MDALARDIGSLDRTRSIGRIRRYWWLALLGAVLGVGAGAIYTSSVAKQYTGNTTLVVFPPPQQAVVIGSRLNSAVNMDNELQFAQSVEVAAAAAKLLGVTTDLTTLESQVTATVPPNTSVIDIAFAAATPQKARQGSHAFAEAYIQSRTDAAAADVAVQVEGLTKQIADNQTQLAVYTAQLTLPTSNKTYQNAVSQSKVIENNLATLQARLSPLSTTDTTAGAIINDAQLPTSPSKPIPPLYIGAGMFAGLIFGLALAVLAARSDRRIRLAEDVEARVGRPVLAEITKPHRGKVVTGILTARSGSGEFDRLRLRLTSATLERVDSVLVCAADPGNAVSFVAGNLAASQARSGQDVVLVSADPDSPTAALFGLDEGPGLGTLLRDEGPIDSMAQSVPGRPRLRVIVPGRDLSDVLEKVPVARIGALVDALVKSGHYVVVEAPPVSRGVEAQELAQRTGAAVVVAEIGVSKVPGVSSAFEELELMGAIVPGAVVVPTLPAVTRQAVSRVGAESVTPEPVSQSRT
jgi:succinoglycan biosynthesis transport protein ExoP